MCNFFSFVTDPINHPAEYYFFDWVYRKANLEDDGVDSHSHICAYYKLNEDKCNKYEYSPVTGEFVVDQINSKRDDQEAAENWVKRLDFKTIVEPLIIKPIVNPLELPKVEHVTDEQVAWLREWDSVWDAVGASVGASVRDSVRASVGASVRASVRVSVWDSVGASVWDSVGASVMASVGDSVRASVRDAVWDSVGASVGAYIGSFFDIDYKFDFSSAVKLWEAGLVPSFDGTTWRLLTGKDAKIIYEWTPVRRVRELESENARLKDAQRWIPASERLPDNWESVLTIDISKSTRDMVSAFYNPETSLWSTHFSMYSDSDLWVTHWMPLPESPIVYGKVCIDQLTAHNATERKDDTEVQE